MHVPPEDVHGHLVRPILAGEFLPDMLVPVRDSYPVTAEYAGPVRWVTYKEACKAHVFLQLVAFDSVCDDPQMIMQLITLYLRGNL